MFIKKDLSGNLLIIILTEFLDVMKINGFIDDLKHRSERKLLGLERYLNCSKDFYSIDIINSHYLSNDALGKALNLVVFGPQLVEVVLTSQEYIQRQFPKQNLDLINSYINSIKYSIKDTVAILLKNCENLEVLERNTIKMLSEASLFYRSKNTTEKEQFTQKVILLPLFVILILFASKGLIHIGRAK